MQIHASLTRAEGFEIFTRPWQESREELNHDPSSPSCSSAWLSLITADRNLKEDLRMTDIEGRHLLLIVRLPSSTFITIDRGVPLEDQTCSLLLLVGLSLLGFT